MKKISVILPVYNVEKYVRKCLLSIVEQSYQNFEVLIVDDGSVDNFFKEIEDIVAENKNIKIYQKANGGLASARNFGLEKANGDYILFIDSDDWIEKDLFKNLVENLSDEDILIFNLGKYSNKEGKIITNRRIKNINKELLKINEGYIFLDEVPNGATIKIYKRSFIEKNNFRFNEGLKLYEDTYWDIITLINTKKVRFLDYVGYWYRVGRDGSLITDLSSEKNKKYQLMIKELLLKLKDENISELVKIKLEILILRIEIELEEISKNFFKEEFTEFFKKSLTIIENEKNTIVKKYFKSKIKKIIENNINKIDIFRYIYIKNNLITLKMIRRKIFK